MATAKVKRSWSTTQSEVELLRSLRGKNSNGTHWKSNITSDDGSGHNRDSRSPPTSRDPNLAATQDREGSDGSQSDSPSVFSAASHDDFKFIASEYDEIVKLKSKDVPASVKANATKHLKKSFLTYKTDGSGSDTADSEGLRGAEPPSDQSQLASSHFKCFKCKKVFATAAFLLAHETVHVGEGPFQCPLCDFCSERPIGLKIHVNAKHKQKKFTPMPDTPQAIPSPPRQSSFDSSSNSNLSNNPNSSNLSNLHTQNSTIPRNSNNLRNSNDNGSVMIPRAQHVRAVNESFITAPSNSYNNNYPFQFPLFRLDDSKNSSISKYSSINSSNTQY